mmetsp:Transcript_3634/g.8646  ORF Transcript_3634/g.8646 Transcript_3634/m.8646 type:complete len:243 (-) Transcript_3634:518-1246(-)
MAEHIRSATFTTCGSCIILKCVPGTLATMLASYLFAASSSSWKVSLWKSRTIFSPSFSSAFGSNFQAIGARSTATRVCCGTSGAEPVCSRLLYHCVVSCRCSKEANALGFNAFLMASSRFCGSVSRRVESSSSYLVASVCGKVWQRSARLSARPEFSKAFCTSTCSGSKERGSSKTTMATCWPCCAATLAISRQTLAPKEWPANRYGPVGCTFWISLKKCFARSCKLLGHSLRATPMGQVSP